ncbi:hypothetical protein LCGC14_1101440 [marine sediment metagenome]|uniref:Uncharacterized protein n=1 Tax=marine sediment metagenome TaxID=412755 RepID=A0A0F9QFI1_9ZZZZ
MPVHKGRKPKKTSTKKSMKVLNKRASKNAKQVTKANRARATHQGVIKNSKGVIQRTKSGKAKNVFIGDKPHVAGKSKKTKATTKVGRKANKRASKRKY